MTTTLDLHRYRCVDGGHATGWSLATRRRRLAATAIDAVLFTATLGVGWSLLFWRTASRGATPGKSLLGLSVFSTDERHQSTRRRLALRTLVYQPLAVLLGAATGGLGWVYALGTGLTGKRQTSYDDWSRTLVLRAPSRS